MRGKLKAGTILRSAGWLQKVGTAQLIAVLGKRGQPDTFGLFETGTLDEPREMAGRFALYKY